MLLHAGEAASTTSRRRAPHAAAPSQAVPERDTALSLFPSDADALLAQLTALSRGLIELQERRATDDSQQPTVGLTGMAERAHLLGGDIGVFSRPAEGVRIAAKLPWRCP